MGCAASEERSDYSHETVEKEKVHAAADFGDMHIEEFQAAFRGDGIDHAKLDAWWSKVAEGDKIKRDRAISLGLSFFAKGGPLHNNAMHKCVEIWRNNPLSHTPFARNVKDEKIHEIAGDKVRQALAPVFGTIFDAVDTDGSGAVEKSEFMAIVTALVQQDASPLVDVGVRIVDTNKNGKLEVSEAQCLAGHFVKVAAIAVHSMIDIFQTAACDMLKKEGMGENVNVEELKGYGMLGNKDHPLAPVMAHDGSLQSLLEMGLSHMHLSESEQSAMPKPEALITPIGAYTAYLDAVMAEKGGETCTKAQWKKVADKTTRKFVDVFETAANIAIDVALPMMKERGPLSDAPPEVQALVPTEAEVKLAVKSVLEQLAKNTSKIGDATFALFQFGKPAKNDISWAEVEAWHGIFQPGTKLSERILNFLTKIAVDGNITPAHATTTVTGLCELLHAFATMMFEGCDRFFIEPAAECAIEVVSGGKKELNIYAFLAAANSTDGFFQGRPAGSMAGKQFRYNYEEDKYEEDPEKAEASKKAAETEKQWEAKGGADIAACKGNPLFNMEAEGKEKFVIENLANLKGKVLKSME